jgi:hypothetical protein
MLPWICGFVFAAVSVSASADFDFEDRHPAIPSQAAVARALDRNSRRDGDMTADHSSRVDCAPPDLVPQTTGNRTK